MSAPCENPIGHERLVAYWCNDLDEAETAAIDEHLFRCDACSAMSGNVAKFAQTFRAMVPPIVSRDQVDALRARGAVIRENDFEPGVRKKVVFERDTEFMIHRLRGLELSDATRVQVSVYSEASGPLVEEYFAPFDVSRGEVLVACQRHFAAFPNDVAFDVHVYRASETTKHTYFIPHEFR